MNQLAFTWQPHTSYAPEDFIVSGCNREAWDFLNNWPNPATVRTALLYGATSSGKTHLASCWLERVHGYAIDKTSLGKKPSESLWPQSNYALLEDIQTIEDASAFFHLLRYAEAENKFLLLTANALAKQLHFTLPDLSSRLRALPTVEISKPDDTLLHLFAAKLFSDRQLRVSRDVIEYIIKQTERSFSGLRHFILQVEAASQESRKDITINLVRKILTGS